MRLSCSMHRRSRPLICVHETLECRLLLSATLDTSYGTGGVAAYSVAGAVLGAAVQQPDGRVMVAIQPRGNANSFLARYDVHGVLDTSFGTNGHLHLDLLNVNDLKLLPSGQILVMGLYVDFPTNQFGVVIERLNANGSLDTSFAVGSQTGNGRAFAIASTEPTAMQVQPDGKIVDLVTNTPAGTRVTGLGRFNADGSIDNSFGSDGVLLLPDSSNLNFQSPVLKLLPDGRIVIGGTSGTASQHTAKLFRLNTDGSTDTSFGGSGEVDLTATGATTSVNSIAVRSDGVLIVGGSDGYVLDAIRPNGSHDPYFNGGRVRGGTSQLYPDSALSVALLPGGEVLAAGPQGGAKAAGFTVFTARGTQDTTFGANGTVDTGLAANAVDSEIALVHGDGSVVLAIQSPSGVQLTRYTITYNSSVSHLVRVYNIVNTDYNVHFYTTSTSEHDILLSLVNNAPTPHHPWVDADVTYSSFAVFSIQPDSRALYIQRLYNPNTSEHYYTISTIEASADAAAGWIWETPHSSQSDTGFQGYMFPPPDQSRPWTSADRPAGPTGTVPVYRMYQIVSNPAAQTGDHTVTNDAALLGSLQRTSGFVEHSMVGFAYLLPPLQPAVSANAQTRPVVSAELSDRSATPAEAGSKRSEPPAEAADLESLDMVFQMSELGRD